MTQLRGYQIRLKDGIYDAWQRGARNVVGVTATGSGKTVTMANMAAELGGIGRVQAHRAELVGQLSIALGQEGLRHNIVAAKETVKAIAAAHMEEFGRIYYDPRANWAVGSVQTIIRRQDPDAHRVQYVFTDEGHHVLADNIWGKGLSLYPNARGLLMTATPTRADGKGLGRHHDGLADAMVLGPGLREQIEQGFLTGYRVAAPTASDLDMSDVHITASGDYNQQEAARAVKRSRKIVGDAVENYQALAAGKLAIVFAADIEHGNTLADAFNLAGVPAAMVTGDTEEADRRAIMRRFKAKELRVLVNVDLFGEGVDVPAVEVVIMCRPTASFALYCQCIGRMLRLNISPILMAAWDTYTAAQRLAHIAESVKPFGILIDHVGNVYREFNVGGHKYSGLPEGFEKWTLDRRQRRASSGGDAIPVRMCGECFKPYERCFEACPYCGATAPEPAVRGGPQQVDGDLRFLDDATLARLRGAITVIDGSARIPQNAPPHVQASAIRAHHERQAAQALLRAAMAQWAGWHHADTLATNHKRFYFRFGVDVLSAMALGAGDAAELMERVNNDMEKYL